VGDAFIPSNPLRLSELRAYTVGIEKTIFISGAMHISLSAQSPVQNVGFISCDSAFQNVTHGDFPNAIAIAEQVAVVPVTKVNDPTFDMSPSKRELGTGG
jgi:hypothetical protein